MLKLQERKISKKKLKNRLIMAVLAIAVILLIRAVWNIYDKNRLADLDRESSDRELKELEKRRTVLESKVNALKTERGIEQEVRKNFSVAKPGEKLVVVVDSTNTATSTTKNGFWQKLFGE